MKTPLFRFETINFKQTLQTDDEEVHDVIRASIIWQTVTTTVKLEFMHFVIKCLVLIPKQEKTDMSQMQPGLSRSIRSYCYVMHSNCKYSYFSL